MTDPPKLYQLHILVPPDEWHQFTRGIRAATDAEAIKRADKFWDKLVADPNLKLDRYVLQEGERLVHERRR